MAASMSKRNQARNEQALQELIRGVPGNERCADCEARNPALHRKLGTHISKVKSLSMDAWTNDQVEVIKTYPLQNKANLVENMKNIGNVKANESWNPQRKKADIPLDIDEVDFAMERFIRQKYEQKLFVAGAAKKPVKSPSMPLGNRRTDSPVSFDENPPPPPPKGRKFGLSLRSSSSGSFLSRGNKEDKQKKLPNVAPLALNKESRVFGATIGVTQSDKGLEMKLLQLKEMGFPDTQRNTTVLKGNGGDLERTIESLVKLGEGSGLSAPPRRQATSTPTQQATTSSPQGASVVRSSTNPDYNGPSSTSQTSRSNNPFEAQEKSATSAFDAAMANMTISSPQPQTQSLFPNTTGGQLALSQQVQQSPYQQSMTPPVLSPQQFLNNPYSQQPTHNPFMVPQLTSQSQPQTNPYMATTSPNPFFQQASQNQMLSPQYSTFSPQQSVFSPQQQQFVQSPQSSQPLMNDFGFQLQQGYQSPAFNPQSPAGYYNPYQQQIMPQPTGKLDKNSIMALYNYPQLAPSNSTGEQTTSPAASPLQGSHSPSIAPPQRSATTPLVGSKNPFAPFGNPN